jgi:sugar O-acyltransferase (sialic acid O-acetyltransferase NeuD family)
VTTFVCAPRINANEDTVKLVVWTRQPGNKVETGETIAVFETQKATFDLDAESGGYLQVRIEAGTAVPVGSVVGAITEAPGADVTWPVQTQPPTRPASDRRLTKKAELTARRAGLDLATVMSGTPGDGPITEAAVEEFLKARPKAPHERPASVGPDTVDSPFPANRQQRILIIGAGNAAVQLIDLLARVPGQRPVACVDDAPKLHGRTVMGVPVIGACSKVRPAFEDGLFDACIVSVSKSIAFRERMFEELAGAGIPFTNVIDPSASIRTNVTLGQGNVILAYTHVGACSSIGNGNFLGPFADIEHHNTVGNFCTFGPGVLTSGGVTIGDRVKFGTGIFIEPHLTVGSDSIVASGAILTANVPDGSLVKTRTNYVIKPRPMPADSPSRQRP